MSPDDPPAPAGTELRPSMIRMFAEMGLIANKPAPAETEGPDFPWGTSQPPSAVPCVRRRAAARPIDPGLAQACGPSALPMHCGEAAGLHRSTTLAARAD